MYLPSDPKIWEEVSNDKLIRKPQFWLPMLGGLLIILGVPDNIFQQFPSLWKFIKIISSFVPSINTWVERSSHPEATSLLLTYCWILIPYYAWVIYKEYYDDTFNNKQLQLWTQGGWKRHFIPIRFIVVFAPITIIFYNFALPAEPSCTRFCIHESLTLQLIVTFCLILLVSFFISTMVFWLKNFRKIHFNNNITGAN